jgi:hypothetical protein
LQTKGWEDWGKNTVCRARGWYEQDGTIECLHIYNSEIDADGLIRGVGQDEDTGVFEIIGTLVGTDFQFNKTYRGGATVSYYGKVKANVWTGKWNDSNSEGEFNLVPKFQIWKGSYFQNEKRQEMNIGSLYVGPSGVKGSGSDVNGKFHIKGVWVSVVSFAKTYTASGNTAFYAGFGSADHIKGSWSMTVGHNKQTGIFKITSKPSRPSVDYSIPENMEHLLEEMGFSG